MTLSARSLSRSLSRSSGLAACVGALLVLAACGGDADGPESPVTVTHGGSAAMPDEPPELITYAGGEAEPPLIGSTDDAARLSGAPESFRDFIGKAATKLVDEADCDGAAVGITVDALRTDGYAVGAVNECGGYAAIWAEVDGTWQEIEGTQDAWDCAVLEQYRVPSDLLLDDHTCYDYDGDQREHDYQQG